jgi:uncharacterized protein (UPF0303 family)
VSIEQDLEKILVQERELQWKQFDPAVAWLLGARLRDVAFTQSLPVVIDIRRFGQPLFYAALAGTTPDNVEWVRRKSNTVARFYRSSYAIGLSLKQQNTNLLEKYGLDLADHAAHGGSFPITLQGSGVVGSVTVSGLPQRQDHEMVVEALCAELGLDYTLLRLA